MNELTTTDLPIDADRVIQALGQQIGGLYVQIAQMQAVIATLLQERNTASATTG